MITKEQLFDLISDLQRNILNFKGTKKDPWELLWKEYNKIINKDNK